MSAIGSYVDATGTSRNIEGVTTMTSLGVPLSDAVALTPPGVPIASLAAAAVSPLTVGVPGGGWQWDVTGTFAGGASLVLESLRADLTTWFVLATATGPGVYNAGIGNNATVRMRAIAGAITNLASSLS
ncbi:hypothetical protein [Caulobacter phage DCM]|uniref:Uncharacterized protein n=2 Tax=Autonotataviridae TaxID=3424634 RepID=A0AAE9X0G1_9CAUD|nr:hypothetical protein [Caulobacter phage DCM]WCA46301.1 hypothetical protein [Caulobacter phage ERS]WCD56133.1 hypothetical protein [Caulobacter phage BL199]